MNITTPEQMSSGTSNLEQTITKFEKKLSECRKDQTIYRLVISGSYNDQICNLIEKAYKDAGWSMAKCRSSDPDNLEITELILSTYKADKKYYNFHIDEKVTIWRRDYYDTIAESEEEAQKLMKEFLQTNDYTKCKVRHSESAFLLYTETAFPTSPGEYTKQLFLDNGALLDSM